MRLQTSIATMILGSLLALGCPGDDSTGDSGAGSADGGPATTNGPDDTTGGGGPSRADAILELSGDAGAGAMVFTSVCGLPSCHGSDGISGVAPSLADRVPLLSSAQIVTVVLEGKVEGGGMAMPSQAHLSDQEIADVVAYVEATFGG